MKRINRRDFGKTLVAAGATTALNRMRVRGANERIRLGFIGVGNRGDQVLDGFLAHKDAEAVAVCDLSKPYMDFAATKAGGHPAKISDYRRLLDRKDIDAVVISTPDHWHALQTIHACQAGKDVYVEKPLSLCVREGRKMVEEAQRHGRVTQVGLHRRSSDFCREAAELIRSGAIGKVSVIRCFHIQNEWPKGIGNPPASDPPAGLDWNAWLGPAAMVPYNPNRAFYLFRWFYYSSGGQLTNFGTHYLDVIQWALGHDAPTSVTAMGGNFAVSDNREIPDTLEVLWTYPGGTLVSFSQFNANGAPADRRDRDIEFRGTKGTLHLRGSSYENVPEGVTPHSFPMRDPLDRVSSRAYRRDRKLAMEPMKKEGRATTANHARNFLECVRSRKKCNCDIETGHRSTTATLLGNVALKRKAYLEWDGKAERFTNHAAANQDLSYNYRAPYKLPG